VDLALPHLAFLVAAYAFLGGAIKYIDQAYDERMGSINMAKTLAVLSGLLMGAIMILDGGFSTAFFMAMLISLVLTKKVDNWSFLVGTVVALITFIIGALIWGAELLPIPIVVFLIAGAVDEIADSYAHGRRLGSTAEYILHYRPFSDVAIVMLVFLIPFDWYYLVPYFAFTLSYLFVGGLEEGQMAESVRSLWGRAVRLRP
jgi:hypothetical protein